MSWTTPKTWATSDVLTAALFNTHIRDNLTALRQANQSYVLAYLTTTQSIANNTWTTVNLDASEKQSGSMLDAANHRLQAPITGTYALAANLSWEFNATGVREARAVNNAGTIYSLDSIRAAASSSWQTVNHGTSIFPLSSGQYITIAGLQTSGVARLLVGYSSNGYVLTRASWYLLGE